MWLNHLDCLKKYYNTALYLWLGRGFKYKNSFLLYDLNFQYPSWFGNEDIHKGMRSNLLRKDYNHYSQFGWNEPTDLPYIWPVKEKKIYQKTDIIL